MNKEMKERYIKMLCEDNSKESLAEDIILRDDRICEFRAWVNQIFAGDTGIVFYDVIEYLKENKQFELAEQLQGVHSYLSTGNRFLRSWTGEDE